MAYEYIDKYTDEIAGLYSKTGRAEYLNSLIRYYEIVLKSAKFKFQRRYCEEVIFRIEPSFYKGYFKRDQPK